MKNFLIAALSCLALVLALPFAHAAPFDIDPVHSSVGFSIHHLVGRVNGTFDEFSGDFEFDKKKPQSSLVEFTVKTTSIDTHNLKRDKHLRSADFFDVEKFPTMTFKSRKLIPAGKNKFKLEGDLTLHGITRPQTFLVELGGMMRDPWNNIRVGFTATTHLNRKDFGVKWNKVLDTGGYMLGDDVQVTLQIEAIQRQAPTSAARN